MYVSGRGDHEVASIVALGTNVLAEKQEHDA